MSVIDRLELFAWLKKKLKMAEEMERSKRKDTRIIRLMLFLIMEHVCKMPEAVPVSLALERPLTIDEVKQVGAFYIEMRSSCFRIYRTDSVRIVRCVDDEAVHLICKYKPHFEIAEFDNYNIGWRAWLKLPTDEISSLYPWDEVKKCKGIGYGWEYNVDQLLSERCDDKDNARVIEIW